MTLVYTIEWSGPVNEGQVKGATITMADQAFVPAVGIQIVFDSPEFKDSFGFEVASVYYNPHSQRALVSLDQARWYGNPDRPLSSEDLALFQEDMQILVTHGWTLLYAEAGDGPAQPSVRHMKLVSRKVN